MIVKLWRRLVRLSFRLLYNEFAFSYDAVSALVSLGRWRRWQRSVLSYLKPDEVGPLLELAHGTGSLQLDLLASKRRTVALDLSPKMGLLAKRKLAKCGLDTNFVRGDALTLPFRDECFHAIVCTFPTSFIFQVSALSEMHRILKANGRAIIVMSGYLSGGGFIRGFIEILYRLTGQTYGEIAAQYVSDHIIDGLFNVDVKEVKLAHSVVTLLVLKKVLPKSRQDSDLYLAMS